MGQITVTELSRLAVKYQPDIKMLPYAVMSQVLGEHGINLFPGVQYKDVIISFLRNQGIAKPYAPGLNVANNVIGKIQESELVVEKAYASVKDNIWNYVTKTLVTPNEMLGKNKTKKHPFEVETMMAMVTTFGEDVLDCLFNGTRNISDQTPLGLFDGFETKVENAIIAGQISEANGNYADSLTFVAPQNEDDYNAYLRIRDWVRGANPYLLKNAILIIPQLVARYAFDALQNKTKGKAATWVDFQEYLNTDCNSNISVKVSRFVGTGDRLYLTTPGNMDFGMNTMADEKFVQIRDIYEDPNDFQYYIQADWGTRWRSFHEKVFYTNTGSLTANQLSGDYIS
jgi:hypothetical protein